MLQCELTPLLDTRESTWKRTLGWGPHSCDISSGANPAEMLPTVRSLLLGAHSCELFLMSDRIWIHVLAFQPSEGQWGSLSLGHLHSHTPGTFSRPLQETESDWQDQKIVRNDNRQTHRWHHCINPLFCGNKTKIWVQGNQRGFQCYICLVKDDLHPRKRSWGIIQKKVFQRDNHVVWGGLSQALDCLGSLFFASLSALGDC